MRILNSGEFRYCRFAVDHSLPKGNIQEVKPLEFFQTEMAPLREQLLAGSRPDGCRECHVMEQHNKLSGRQRQLLKAGVRLEEFAKTMVSSPWLPVWQQDNQTLELAPQDWQVDLGNYCNSACIFCVPEDSSRLAQQYQQLGLLKSAVAPNWTDNPELVERFLEMIELSPNLRYLHFIGGETLITPAFEIILKKIIALGRAKQVSIGFTTNLTTWNQRVVDLTCEFKEINLNVSIESMDMVNDYVRWPSRIDQVRSVLERWVQLSNQRGWLATMRVTPTAVSVHKVKSVYQFAVEHNLNVESCNFLYRPPFMRPTVLPWHIRQRIADDLDSWITGVDQPDTKILNIRHPEYRSVAALQDAASYVTYLRNAPDESSKLSELVTFLRMMDNHRGLCVFDYIPEYEELFRTAGY
jgi:sulfatase maturation enzyme AslB (radical SAM superfamily)